MSLLVSRPHSCEPLESRIAPSVFFVSPSSLAINKDGKDNAAALDLTAATSAGATAALLLHKGDTLVFDANDNGKLDSGDTVLLKVSAGQAMTFLTDTGDGAGGAADAKFEANELTGLAVSDGFTGLGSDVHGTVATALKADGTFSADSMVVTLQHASIKGLTLTGGIIDGALLAGGSISNVTTAAPPHAVPAGVSVTGMVATSGGANAQTVSFNGGGKTAASFFVGNNSESGGNITNVRLATAAGVAAGDAGGSPAGFGGAGGSISGLIVEDLTGDFSITTGNGGFSIKGNGGAGGSFTGSTVHFHPASASDTPSIILGEGGGAQNGNGGAGGAFVKSDFVLNAGAASFALSSGFGGTGGGAHGSGGAGGAISTVSVNTIALSGNLLIQSGGGGISAMPGQAGGAGGAVTGLHVTSGPVTGKVQIESGDGADGFLKGGGGGAVSGLVLQADRFGSLTLTAGHGGNASGSKGVGGAGGAVLSSGVTLHGGATGGIAVSAGAGGTGLTVAGGLGGAVSQFTLVDQASEGSVAGAVIISGGAGGSLSEADGRTHHAADGGAVISVSVENHESLGGLEITSGQGGDIDLGSGSAGNGGNLSKVVLINSVAISGSVKIHSGAGGTGGLVVSGPEGPGSSFSVGVGNGGNSGDVSAIRIDDTAGGSTPFEIYAGVPVVSTAGPKASGAMAGYGAASHGGSIGRVSGVSLNDAGGDSLDSHFIIGKADAAGFGGGGPESHGGNGGSISGVTGLVGTLDILAPAGGNSYDAANNGSNQSGTGGTGGSISGINVSTAGAGHFVHLLAAGDGGNGSTPGVGGSVTKVKVAGDIGNVAGSFNLTTDEAGMGGLVAGRGGSGNSSDITGLNGSISGIDVGAHTIAAILAGRPAANGITIANAVTKISGIVAAKIGADNSTIGVFDFTEGSSSGDTAFQPSSTNPNPDGDTALDGLVIVKKGGAVLPVSPLLLVEVDV